MRQQRALQSARSNQPTIPKHLLSSAVHSEAHDLDKDSEKNDRWEVADKDELEVIRNKLNEIDEEDAEPINEEYTVQSESVMSSAIQNQKSNPISTSAQFNNIS